jgi:hypothetical protein
VSIAGCRLETGVSQVFFYRQPSSLASTECPLPALKQLNFWMQISSQLKGPKHEIFKIVFFTQIRPVRVSDLGTGEKNEISLVEVLFLRFFRYENLI